VKPFRPALATGALALCASILQLAVITPAQSEQAPAPVIVDMAGDANSVFMQLGQPSQDTRPVSDDRADLIKIWPETTYETVVDRASDGSIAGVRHVPVGLRINVQTTAKANPATGPTLWFILPVVANGCEISFQFYTQGPAGIGDMPEVAEIEDTLFDGVEIGNPGCLNGKLNSSEFGLAFDGSVTRLDFPFAALRGTRAEELVAPGISLGPSSEVPRFIRVRQSPEGATVLYGGVDEAGSLPSEFLIGSDVPADINCNASPGNPACAG
jgi:hypothetical protein